MISHAEHKTTSFRALRGTRAEEHGKGATKLIKRMPAHDRMLHHRS